jgi:hypothetical protein
MSWEQFRSIVLTNRSNMAAEQSRPPTACPFDGTPLEIRADGIRNCPRGDFTYPGGLGII